MMLFLCKVKVSTGKVLKVLKDFYWYWRLDLLAGEIDLIEIDCYFPRGQVGKKIERHLSLIPKLNILRDSRIGIALPNCIHQSLKSDSAEIQILFTVCQGLTVVRISGNGFGWN